MLSVNWADLPYYCLNCTTFAKFILRKIIKIVAIRCRILKAKMHQIRFRLGLCPRPRAGGAYISQQTP